MDGQGFLMHFAKSVLLLLLLSKRVRMLAFHLGHGVGRDKYGSATSEQGFPAKVDGSCFSFHLKD